MFQNVYLRERDGARMPMGLWPNREVADAKAAFNERAGFTRVECREVSVCPDCDGFGTVDYYVGSFGTYGCSGLAEKTCDTCRGTGEA